MINRIKQLVNDSKNRQKQIMAQNDELLWTAIFHDSIRGKKGIESLPLNIGRWAGNYSFFYILNRILNDFQPKRIIEFGLGESSKFVSVYLDNYLLDSDHVIIEQDTNWKTSFEDKFILSKRSSIRIMPLLLKSYKGFEYNGYENIETIKTKFNLYIIDGPFGSSRYSRFDIYALAEKLTEQDDFIIIMDDYNRNGERETTAELLTMFENKNIRIHAAEYNGLKSVKVLGSEKFKYITTL